MPMRTQPLATLDYTESEMVLGFVYAVGTNTNPVLDTLQTHMKKFGYVTQNIRLSDFLPAFVRDLGLPVQLKDEPEHDRIATLMDAGNACRSKLGRGDALALAAVAQIHQKRRISEEGGTEEPFA